MEGNSLIIAFFSLTLVLLPRLHCRHLEGSWNEETSKHHNNLELNLFLQKVHSKCPSISRLYQLSERSINGWPLTVIELSSNPGEHQLCMFHSPGEGETVLILIIAY